MKTGNWATSGRHDAAGLMRFSREKAISSSFCFARSPLYFFWISFICGAWACRFCIEWICRTVSGTRTMRTRIVRPTIDEPHGRPIAPCGPSQSRTARNAFSSGVRMPPTITRRASGRGRGRRRLGSTDCSAGAASRRARSRGRGVGGAERRARTASTRGGTGRWSGRAPRRSPGRARRGRLRRTSRSRLSEHLVDPLPEPVEPAGLDGIGKARPGDQHVVTTDGDLRQPGPPRLAKLALDPVPDDGATGSSWDGEADARRAVVVTRKGVENEKARRDRAALAIDRVEVPRAREAMPALHVFPLAGGARQAERRVRPFARRRLMIARPALVAIRARKPCRRFRRRTFG